MVGVTLALLALLLLLLLLRCLFTLVSPRQAPISLLEDLSFYTAATALPPYAHIDGEHADSPSPAHTQRRLRRGEPTVSTPLRVVVTGGAGFLGAAIVRQLRQRGHQITVLDRCLPAARNRVHGATYAVVDLVWDDAHAGAAAAEQRVVGCCRSADAVVHAAGCVCLLDDPGRLHNAHVVATAHVIRCARLAGVRALVCTSSTSAVTSPFLHTPQLRVPCDLLLPRRGFPFASHYSRTKYEAERLAISAHRPPELAVTVLRLPGVYGLGDSRIVDLLLSGLMTHVPSGGEGCLIDFCYVENAAHAHCVAVEALLLRGTGAPGRGAAVGGRAFNVSNGEGQTRPTVAMWNELLAICHPSGSPEPRRQLRRLPFTLAYALACGVEALDWLTVGRVPWPRAAIWSLTRSSLGFATTPVTLQLSPDLGYVPPYGTTASFVDIQARAVEARGGKRRRSASSPSPARCSSPSPAAPSLAPCCFADPASLFVLSLLPVPLLWRGDHVQLATPGEALAYITGWPLLLWSAVGCAVCWLAHTPPAAPPAGQQQRRRQGSLPPPPCLSVQEVCIARWYLLNGAFFNSMMDVCAGQLQAWPLMTQQYNEIEPRYAPASDSPACQMGGALVALTSLQEILFQTPLGLGLYWAYHRGSACRLPAEILFNACSVGGVWYFYGAEAWAGFPCVSAPSWVQVSSLSPAAFTPAMLFEFWLGFVIFPLLWVCIGVALLVRASWQVAALAVEADASRPKQP